MSEPFLAEIKIVGFDFAPRGWAFCDGQILQINQFQSLYSLLGTTYGGDGRTSFGLPDLRGRTPIHEGEGHTLGQKSGEETHSLSVAEMPGHGHVLNATSGPADSTDGTGRLLADTSEGRFAISPYTNPTSLTDMHPASMANAGTGAGHENMQPYLALRFCIALSGLFPSRN